MLRCSTLAADSFKEHYHRVHLPRRLALQRHIRQQNLHNRAKAEQEVPYRYNRWWVNADHKFVHQYAVVEDPAVTRAKREELPPVTKENIWKEPQQTFFLPFAPYIRVVDYPKDPDAKFLKPVNVPRWKDYMQRTKPVVPRTWY